LGDSKSAAPPIAEVPSPSCPKNFETRSALHTHMELLHGGAKDFHCLLCGTSFGDSSHLHAHIKLVHRDGQNHGCDQCGQAFGYASDLRKHRTAMHNMVARTFSCSECGKTFGQAGNMRTHMKAMHNGTEFRCARCGVASAISARETSVRAACNKPMAQASLQCIPCFTRSEREAAMAQVNPSARPLAIASADAASTALKVVAASQYAKDEGTGTKLYGQLAQQAATGKQQ